MFSKFLDIEQCIGKPLYNLENSIELEEYICNYKRLMRLKRVFFPSLWSLYCEEKYPSPTPFLFAINVWIVVLFSLFFFYNEAFARSNEEFIFSSLVKKWCRTATPHIFIGLTSSDFHLRTSITFFQKLMRVDLKTTDFSLYPSRQNQYHH